MPRDTVVHEPNQRSRHTALRATVHSIASGSAGGTDMAPRLETWRLELIRDMIQADSYHWKHLQLHMLHTAAQPRVQDPIMDFSFPGLKVRLMSNFYRNCRSDHLELGEPTMRFWVHGARSEYA
jgi:hypothetical protein